MDTDALRLTLIAHDDDGTALLRVEVRAGAFAGAGEAWVDRAALSAFGRRVAESHPLTADPPLRFEAGPREPDGTRRAGLALAFAAANRRGGVRAEVDLCDESASLGAPCHRLQTHLLVEAESLRAFGANLARLAAGVVQVAALSG